MGWQTREHWRNGTHQLWLQELQDVFSAGWRVEWSWPMRRGESFCNDAREQPPDLGEPHADREALARQFLADKMAKIGDGWEQIG